MNKEEIRYREALLKSLENEETWTEEAFEEYYTHKETWSKNPTPEEMVDDRGYNWGSIDWSGCPEVESVHGRMGGQWVFVNTRIPVGLVFDYIATGGIKHFRRAFPQISRQQVVNVLKYLHQDQQRRTPPIKRSDSVIVVKADDPVPVV